MPETLYLHTDKELKNDLKSAEILLSAITGILKPSSVLDVGCGLGHFIKQFLDLGINDVLAVDGDYLNPELLCIPKNFFRVQDLTKSFDFGRNFDLVMSLEVAEHLPISCANQFVDSLVLHGDVILFSAAFPGQGGQNHLNEQWAGWWGHLFKERGYYPYDIIRHHLLEKKELPYWYRYNTILYTKSQTMAPSPMQSDFLEHVLTGSLGIKLSARCLISAIHRKLLR